MDSWLARMRANPKRLRKMVAGVTAVAVALMPLISSVIPAVASVAIPSPPLPSVPPFPPAALTLPTLPFLQTAVPEFYSALIAGFSLIFLSEIGDKTFFISALLSLKYSRRLVFIGTTGALILMTAISVLIGQVFHALPFTTTVPFDDYAAAALLVLFGVQNIKAGLEEGKEGEENEEFEEAQQEVEKQQTRFGLSPTQWAILVETFSLIFVAEWGDKSMISTIALGAAKNPWGVVVGGSVGHMIATFIAVVGGSLLTSYVSERAAALAGGVVFLLFAGNTFLEALSKQGITVLASLTEMMGRVFS